MKLLFATDLAGDIRTLLLDDCFCLGIISRFRNDLRVCVPGSFYGRFSLKV